jgi:GlcNAc-PI de-N-acetylase
LTTTHGIDGRGLARYDDAMSGGVVDSRSGVAALGTILGVWAHPDDEAYLSGGLMAMARDLGSRVVCVTATRGELGTTDPVAWPPTRLATARRRQVPGCCRPPTPSAGRPGGMSSREP